MNCKKKLLLVLVMFIFFVGCEVDYTLEVNQMGPIETISIMALNEDVKERYRQDDVRLILNQLVNSFESDYVLEDYDINIIIGDEISGVKMISTSYDYNVLKYSSPFINDCFDYVDFVKTRENVVIETDSNFHCGDFFDKNESFNVIIETEMDVLDENSQLTNDGKFIWEINPSKDDVHIKFVTNLNQSGVIATAVKSGGQLVLILLLLISIVAGIASYIYFKYKKANQF